MSSYSILLDWARLQADAHTLALLAALLGGLALLALAIIDAREQQLPNWLTLPLLVSGALSAPLLWEDWEIHLLAGGLASVLLIGMALLSAEFYRALFRPRQMGEVYRAWRARRAKPGAEEEFNVGFGMGDAKLLSGLAFWLSWGVSLVLMVMCVSAIIYWLILAARTAPEERMKRIPMGPFIALGVALVLLGSLLLG